MSSTFLSVQRRGVIALPTDLRRRLHLDTPGAQVEVTETAEGEIVLKPMIPVDATQAWFWEADWQAGERQASTEMDAGLGKSYSNVDDFLDDLG